MKNLAAIDGPAPPVRLRPAVVAVLSLTALSLQAFAPASLPFAIHLDLPLLVLVYLALLRRQPLIGMLIGMLLGMAQDALTHGPIGFFGLIKTVIGYSASSLSHYVEADLTGPRAVLAALFYLAHQVLYWVLDGALLSGGGAFEVTGALILAAIHAGLAILMYRFFDALRGGSE